MLTNKSKRKKKNSNIQVSLVNNNDKNARKVAPMLQKEIDEATKKRAESFKQEFLEAIDQNNISALQKLLETKTFTLKLNLSAVSKAAGTPKLLMYIEKETAENTPTTAGSVSAASSASSSTSSAASENIPTREIIIPAIHPTGNDLLEYATNQNKLSALDFLILYYKKRNDEKPFQEILTQLLNIAICNNANSAILLKLIEQGADVKSGGERRALIKNTKNNKTTTRIYRFNHSSALGFAITEGNVTALNLLMPSANLKDWRVVPSNLTPLSFSIGHGKNRKAIVDTLIKQPEVREGLEIVDHFGYTSLIRAVELGDAGIVQTLKENGAKDELFKQLNYNPSLIVNMKEKAERENFTLPLRVLTKVKQALKESNDISFTKESAETMQFVENTIAVFFATCLKSGNTLWSDEGHLQQEIVLSGQDFDESLMQGFQRKEKARFLSLFSKRFSVPIRANELVIIAKRLLENFKPDTQYLQSLFINILTSLSPELQKTMDTMQDLVAANLNRGGLKKIHPPKKNEPPEKSPELSSKDLNADDTTETALSSNLACSLNSKSLLQFTTQQPLTHLEIQALVYEALEGASEIAQTKKDSIAKAIANVTHTFTLSKIRDDQFCFIGKADVTFQGYALQKTQKAENILHISKVDLLKAFQQIVTSFEQDLNQDLPTLILKTLYPNTKEIKEMFEKVSLENQKRVIEQINCCQKLLQDILNKRIQRILTQVNEIKTNLQKQKETITKLGLTSIHNGQKILDTLNKVEQEIEALEKDLSDKGSAGNKILENLTELAGEVKKVVVKNIIPITGQPPKNKENDLLAQDPVGAAQAFSKQIESIESQIVMFKEKISSVQSTIERHEQHQTNMTLRESSQMATALKETQIALEMELSEKKKKTEQLEVLDAELAKRETDKLLFLAAQKQADARAEKEKVEQLLREKKEKADKLNTAILAATEVEPFKKPAAITLSAASDLLPKLSVAESIKPLKATLEKTKLIGSQNATLEHLMIERSALLCLTARLMDGLKGYPDTALFSSKQAEKMRDVIFHYRSEIIMDINLNVANSKAQTDALKLAQKMNEKIRDMVTSIVDFMSNETQQKECKGHWESINAKLNSPLLNQILNLKENPRTNLATVKTQLQKAEERLKFFKDYLESSKNTIDADIVMNAIYSAYAEAGAFAADYRRINRTAYNNDPKLNTYDQYIEHGNDVRHGRIPNLKEAEQRKTLVQFL